jgi:hypothetical protein
MDLPIRLFHAPVYHFSWKSVKVMPDDAISLLIFPADIARMQDADVGQE